MFEYTCFLQIRAYTQPQDAGIIHVFKIQIQTLQTRHTVDNPDDLLDRAGDVGKENFERRVDSLFHVDVIVTMCWAEQTWGQVTDTIIANFWPTPML